MASNFPVSKHEVPIEVLAGIGGDSIAYVRELDAAQVPSLFPGAPPIAAGLKLWALLAADGTPILLAETRAAAEANAFENDLTTVSVH